MSQRAGRLSRVDDTSALPPSSARLEPSTSPIAPTRDERQRLAGSPWHGFVELTFPTGADVHAGVFSVISQALGERPHFSLRVDQTVCVTMAVEDDSALTRARMVEVAAHLGELLPNSVISGLDLEYRARPAAGPCQPPPLSIVANEGEVARE